MLTCPLCHRSHDDAPSPGRTRVCIACTGEAAALGRAFKAPAKKKRSKQTPKPIEDLPPKTE